MAALWCDVRRGASSLTARSGACGGPAPPPGFEPGPSEPKSEVLPLHHGGQASILSRTANAIDPVGSRRLRPVHPGFPLDVQPWGRGWPNLANATVERTTPPPDVPRDPRGAA